MSDDKQHSELGASVCERFWNCPASVRLSRGIPNRGSKAADRGTAAHEVAHLCLVSGQDAAEYVGRIVHGVEIDADMADGVQIYLDDCRSLQGTVLPSEMRYEVRFDLAQFDPPEPMFGTADFVAYSPMLRKLWVKDFKNGYLYVDAVGNKQLRYYALGALAELGGDKPVSEVEITICQPNSFGATLKRETFDAIELAEWSIELMDRARRTQDPDAPACAGSWCKFCPVSGRCDTQAAARLAEAGAEFALVPESVVRLPEVRLLTPAQRGSIQQAAPLIREFLKAVEATIAADPTGTGWKVIATEGRAAWRDEAAAAETLETLHEVSPWAPREVVSPAKARGLLTDALRPSHKTKKAAEEKARALLADLLHTPKSGAAVVPDADPRPALPTGGAEFLTINHGDA